MDFTLFTQPSDPAGQKIIVAAAIGGVPLNVKHMSLEECDTLAFRNHFTQRKLPALLTSHGGIQGDTAILRFVSRVAPQSELFGRNFNESAIVDSWLGVAAAELAVLHNAVAEESSQSTVKEVSADLRRFMRVLNQQLLTRTYLVGQHITAADISVVCSLRALVDQISEASVFGAANSNVNVRRWYDTCINQPQFLGVLGSTGANPAVRVSRDVLLNKISRVQGGGQLDQAALNELDSLDGADSGDGAHEYASRLRRLADVQEGQIARLQQLTAQVDELERGGSASQESKQSSSSSASAAVEGKTVAYQVTSAKIRQVYGRSKPCASCNKPGATSRCSLCKAVSYCDRKCQTAHWKADHKTNCPRKPVPSPSPTSPATKADTVATVDGGSLPAPPSDGMPIWKAVIHLRICDWASSFGADRVSKVQGVTCLHAAPEDGKEQVRSVLFALPSADGTGFHISYWGTYSTSAVFTPPFKGDKLSKTQQRKVSDYVGGLSKAINNAGTFLQHVKLPSDDAKRRFNLASYIRPRVETNLSADKSPAWTLSLVPLDKHDKSRSAYGFTHKFDPRKGKKVQ